ncbi:thiamine pyrophosphate-binding protein [Shimia marina]|uniref:Acetolactate synthase isozyme 3 large subunit n=1 Tax=Shimia marina TaxID=321267 RepID=A0A0P1EPH0_9RHOB|nr:thiamine pyrophosphate-binding protein [Shimia marina]CUH52192.1 Acetolactate synthase isozyme 3 large subunit [Shimia marina]SFE71909.1 acetolactate synthase-1/2/3 large subunit [Shimia marina]
MTVQGSKHGGKVLVDALERQGIKRVFSVPGESFLAALDGLYDAGIENIVTRQEGGATMMADAHGKLTGEPGVAFVTRGPGATNASSGVHVAFQDSTPMILFIGQVASDQRDREAFQEVDYRAMFGPLAKWVAEIDRVDRIPEYVARAYRTAMSGRPGPVVLALPEDMLSSPCDATVAPAATLPSAKAHDDDVDQVLSLMQAAQNPLVLLGGGRWTTEAAQAVGTLAEKLDLPVAATFRCQDYLDNRHANYVGDVGIGINPQLAERVRNADYIFCLGARLGEMTTSGYTLLSAPTPMQKLVHVHADANELGRVYHPTHAVAADAGVFAAQLAARVADQPAIAPSARVTEARADYEAWQQPVETPGALKMENVIHHLNEVLPDDAILTNGAGNYAAWLHRYYRYRDFGTQLAPTCGSMGYGLPAAVAAKLERPEQEVICLAGDGCFQMTMQEFGVACEQGANLIVLISNNGMYGTIRLHQQKKFPKRPSGTTVFNPNFAQLAQSYGAFGAAAETDAEFRDALAQARAANSPAIIELRIDPKALGPMAQLEELDS